ncbi:hypothetical protein QBC38DRAFT_361549, partial [Podospora fimiseda]
MGLPDPVLDPPARPTSPWFDKYGGRSDTLLDLPTASTNQHSGISPMLPYVSPEARLRNSTGLGAPPPRPNDIDLDRVLSSERQQVEWNAGLATWEATVMNKYMWEGIGDQDILTKAELDDWGFIKVNENNWNPVFKRNKWFDLKSNIFTNDKYFDDDTMRDICQKLDLRENDYWSVDHDGIWQELRVAIELANRWLGYMARGPWLNHIIDRMPDAWDGALGDTYFETLSGLNIEPQRFPEQNPLNQPHVVLNFIATLVGYRIAWRFTDDENYEVKPEGGKAQHYDGRTTVRSAGRRGNLCVAIDINVQPLRVLLNPKATFADRCMATFKLAATILRELTVACWKTRQINNPGHPAYHTPGTVGRETYKVPDPFYGFEWISNLGKSGMNSFFGCDIVASPESVDKKHFPGNQLMLSAYDFPDPQFKRHMAPWDQDYFTGKIYDAVGYQTQRSPLLGAWIASLMREDFYTEAADRIGLRAFHAPRVFPVDCYYHGYTTNVVREAQYITGDKIDAIRHTIHPGVYKPLLQTMVELARMREQWRALTPWRTNEDFNLWNRTPYSMPSARAIVYKFREVYDRVRPQYEREMRRYTEDGLNLHNIMTIKLIFREHKSKPLNPLPLHTWVYNVIACFMAAVLPRRSTMYTGPPRFEVDVSNWWLRSDSYRQYVNTLPANATNVWSFAKATARHTRYARRLGRYWDGRIILDRRKGVHRHEYVQAAQILINEFENLGYHLPKPLWMALRQQMAQLQQQILVPGPAQINVTQWASFSFDLPPFKRDDPLIRPATAGGPLVAWVPGTPLVQVPAAPGGWSLLPMKDGSYEIYDLTELRAQAIPTLGDASIYEKRKDISSRVIKSKRVKELIKTYELQPDGELVQPVGKLIVARHIQEVAERDGADRRELWCVLGHWIYNLTDHPPRPQKRFTREQLTRHLYKEIGMYCAIDTSPDPAVERLWVYDLAPYLESHPGGSEILRDCAGKIITPLFRTAHPDNWQEILRDIRAPLKVGRIV